MDDPKVIHKYCKDVIYMGTREMSFEEIKAQLPRYDMLRKKNQEQRYVKFLHFEKSRFHFMKKDKVQNSLHRVSSFCPGKVFNMNNMNTGCNPFPP